MSKFIGGFVKAYLRTGKCADRLLIRVSTQVALVYVPSELILGAKCASTLKNEKVARIFADSSIFITIVLRNFRNFVGLLNKK